jgi:hypothetical protein
MLEPKSGRWCRRRLHGVSAALITGRMLGIDFFLRTRSGKAAGLVTSCDEVALRTALAGGGTVTFACSGSPSIALSSQLVITAPATIDGTNGGSTVILSGLRVFSVTAGSRIPFRKSLGRALSPLAIAKKFGA